MKALRTSLGSNGHTVGDTCIDLYAERVMIPRISLFSLLTGLSVLTFLLVRHRRRRKTRQLAKLLPEKVVLESSPMPDQSSWKRYFACFLATTVAWITIFLCTFHSSTAMPSTSMSAAQARPRIVFSFTTTTRGINEMQSTVDALVHQEGEGFDAVYVIVPKMYRDEVVAIPDWLLDDRKLNRTEFRGIHFGMGNSPYHDKLRLIVLDTDFGPASKVLGTLLVEQDPDTIIVYGDDDRVYPPQLCERALHYTHKYPNDAIAVLGGWIAAEDGLYCGRSLAVGVNSVSFVGGAGGVAVKRKFFGLEEATMPAFEVANMSKACFLGDDYYLSHLLSRNGVRRRLVSDSCWNIEMLTESFSHGGLSYAPSEHPGGANVEHYQQCIRELGKDQDLSHDGEFGSLYMFLFSRTWGVIRGFKNLYFGGEFVSLIQSTAAMNGELRIYREPNFKRLRRIIGVSTGNLCYDMPCSDLSGAISSARWTGIPTTGSPLSDGEVKIAFYAGNNCTGKAVVLNTIVGEVSNFADFGKDNATTSFAVLEMSMAMLHPTTDVCKW
ncbi:hypothetical protein PHMEG_00017693 [Phytophthora megakarya]|uniref:Uncharacterized protein n=1 Tax=Phytophthora megakarya TaxID=4795 RepID=A0A225VVN1_9STRA|nr:hypothetical protein PHMEG_00017693 [Phytophthora megakarya]